MAKDINLTSQEWNDIIFEGKNKAYGSYELRLTTSRRLIIAFLVSLAIVIFVSFLPTLIETVASATRNTADNISDSSVLADLRQRELEEQVAEKDIIREESAPPPPPLKSSIQFTAPEIVSSDEITDEDQMKSQDELAATNVTISIATVIGDDEEHGMLIEDLQEHKVIAEDEAQRIYDFVEQPAEFPGGEAALMKYLYDNIKYPVIAQENNISGRVNLRFVVERDGRVGDVQVVRGSGDASLDREAVRVVNSLPNFIPAKQNGRAVRVYYNLPVTFRLE